MITQTKKSKGGREKAMMMREIVKMIAIIVMMIVMRNYLDFNAMV